MWLVSLNTRGIVEINNILFLKWRDYGPKGGMYIILLYPIKG